MKRLIYPDVHHRIAKLETFLLERGDEFDERYFLGDFQDDFGDNPYIAASTARYVKGLLEDPRNKICLGNHDMPYFYPYNTSLSCPGFEIQKSLEIGKILSMDDWRKMKLAYYVDGWLISHAGIHPNFLGWPRVTYKDITVADILLLCDKALERVDNNGSDPLLMPGMDRGFVGQEVGGITWLCWSRFKSIPGLNQIVGHTPNRTPSVKYIEMDGLRRLRPLKDWNLWDNKPSLLSTNWCIDTDNGDHYAVLENGAITVFSIAN